MAEVEDEITFDFDMSGWTLYGASAVKVDIVLLNRPFGGCEGLTNPVTDLDLKKKVLYCANR